MTNAELLAKIKAEIERRINAKADSIPTHGDMSIGDYATLGGMASLQDLLSFLSTLESEKPVPNDLEEAAEKAYPSTTWKEGKVAEHIINLHCQKAFIAGYNLCKEQMMEEAVEGEVTTDNRGNSVVRAGVFNKDLEYGDKVRIIIVKED